MIPHATIVQFAKQPQTGKVKTRLIPALGAEKAQQLHRSLVQHVWRQLHAAGLAPVTLWVDGLESNGFFDTLLPKPSQLYLQQGADLGQRMHHALRQTLESCQHVILVGSDCPILDQSYLTEALAALEQGTDVVLGPASDGGYVLIGMSKPWPALFESIDWGTERVLSETRKKLQQAGCSWHELPERWDVDRPEDLAKIAPLGLL